MSARRIIPPLLIIAVLGCDQKNNKTEKNLYATTFDSSYAVIPHDTSDRYYMSRLHSIFGEGYTTTSLTTEDFIVIDSLLDTSIVDYNKSLSDSAYKISFSKGSYKKQIIVILDYKGEKVAWVNCFCDVGFGGMKLYWKTKVIQVEDGGNCYLHFKVNLSQKRYYDLSVNGEA